MSRLTMIEPEKATGEVEKLFEALTESFGLVPNIARALANSPVALKGYFGFGQALEDGVLGSKLREQIALTVSEANSCGYCVASHCAIGRSVGLSDRELADSRQAASPDSRVEAALRFAKQLVEQRGRVTDNDLSRVRRAGYNDGAIAEIVAIVSWKTFANYFNHVAEVGIDFPEPEGD